MNILVGPNNSGKSTIVGALRALASGLRVARSRAPERIQLNAGMRPGYRISPESLPISLENVHSDYEETESTVTFVLSNASKLHLVFPRDGGCVLVPEASATRITTAAAFKREFPISLVCVPVLGPVEHREVKRERETVVSAVATHRASRHFRSYWSHFPEHFEEFATLVRDTWPGMEVSPPEVSDYLRGELAMFCQEERQTRELYWVGFGFQVWCQLLTHLCRAKNSSLVVIDEPEVYLHPDVQRQLLGIIRDISADVVLATHSTEIMAEADPTDIVSIDKRLTRGERLKDTAGVQKALDAIGSNQNIALTALTRNRRVVFVEGDSDFRIVRRFARKCGFVELSGGLGLTNVDSGGFGSWQRITALSSGITAALGTPLKIAALYDRDYYCLEEISTVLAALRKDLAQAWVLERKEIENYLLVPAALQKALEHAIAERAHRTGEGPQRASDVTSLLISITDSMRDNVQSQLIARRATYLRSSGRDIADITRETLAVFGETWGSLEGRLALVSGKETLALLRERLHRDHGISLTDARIIDAMAKGDIPRDLAQLLAEMDAFRTAKA